MAFDATGDFQGLVQNLKAPQYGQTNPDLSMSAGKTARSMALQNALNAMKQGDLGLQGQEQELGYNANMDKLKSEQAGPLDWLGSALGLGGAIKSKIQKNDAGF